MAKLRLEKSVKFWKKARTNELGGAWPPLIYTNVTTVLLNDLYFLIVYVYLNYSLSLSPFTIYNKNNVFFQYKKKKNNNNNDNNLLAKNFFLFLFLFIHSFITTNIIITIVVFSLLVWPCCCYYCLIDWLNRIVLKSICVCL